MNISEHPRLNQLLSSIRQDPQHNSEHVEQQIWDLFGQSAAVVVTDMSSFSKITQEKGIVAYLALIKQMQDIVSLSVKAFNGKVIKYFADNAFLLFPTPDDALACVLDINQAFCKENARSIHEFNIEISAGIDFGHILNINDTDIFGSPVNQASKMGEDIARPWEVMLTKEAFALLTQTDQSQWIADSINISGIDIDIMKRKSV